MTHGTCVRKRRLAATALASAWGTLCRLSASDPWVWLVRPSFIEASSLYAVVLLHGLPGFLVTLGEGGLGHG